MSDEKEPKQKVRREIAEFLRDSAGAFIGGRLVGAMLIVWAAVTFFISNTLQTENILFIIFIGIVLFPCFMIPVLLFEALADWPRRNDKREREAEEFYRSRMKKPVGK